MLTWILSLRDKTGAGASSAVGNLGKVDKALGKTEDQAKRTEQALGKVDKNGRLRDAKGKFLGGLGGGGGGAEKSGGLFGKSWSKGFKSAAKVGAAGVALGVATVVGTAVAGLGAAAEFALPKLGEVVEGAMDKGALMKGLAILLGGADKAEVAYSKVAKHAQDIGLGPLAAAKQVQGLLSSGFKLEGDTGAIRMLDAAQAMKVLNPRADTERMLDALSQIRSKGKLTMEELRGQLGDSAKMDVGAVVSELAKMRGKGSAEIEKMISKGLIGSEEGISAVLKSIETKGGTSLSNLAATGKGSFGNMLQRLQGLPSEIGAQLDLSKFFASGSAAIDKIIAKLTDPRAAKFFDSLFNKMAPGVFDSVGKAFDNIVDALSNPKTIEFLEQLASVGGAAIEGLGEGFKAMAEVMGDMGSNDLSNLAEIARVVGYAIGAAAAAAIFAAKTFDGLYRIGVKVFGGIGDAAAEVASGISDVFSGIGSAVSSVVSTIWGVVTFVQAIPSAIAAIVNEIVAKALSLGSSIIDGIVSGISAGVSAVVNAVKGVATAAIDAAKSVLKTGSPSRVFEEQGEGMSIGQARGVERKGGDVVRAVERVNYGATDAGSTAAQQYTQRTGDMGTRAGAAMSRSWTSNSTSNSKTFTIGPVIVNGGKDAQSTAGAVNSALRGLVEAHG